MVPPIRTKPTPGLTEASELKSVGLSHSAAQTRISGPAGPLTTRLLRPTNESEAEFGRSDKAKEIWRAATPLQVPPRGLDGAQDGSALKLAISSAPGCRAAPAGGC